MSYPKCILSLANLKAAGGGMLKLSHFHAVGDNFESFH